MYKYKTLPFKEIKIGWCTDFCQHGDVPQAAQHHARGRMLEQGCRRIPPRHHLLHVPRSPHQHKGSQLRRWHGVPGGRRGHGWSTAILLPVFPWGAGEAAPRHAVQAVLSPTPQLLEERFLGNGRLSPVSLRRGFSPQFLCRYKLFSAYSG